MQRAALLLAMIAVAREVIACAPAPRAGENAYVVEESAVIVWDPSTKTEHFIRRATFQSKARDFGFLVPTPSAPALAEVPDAIFEAMHQQTAPKMVYKVRKTIDWTPALFGFFFLKSETGPIVTGAAPVNVLATQKIAGYDAAVLDASDATALRDWLGEHGYATSPDLVEWLDGYVRQRWKITAFKIDKSQAEDAAQTSAVKMSFTTEQPFFPYREPASQRVTDTPGPKRGLRVFFLGPDRVRGTIGKDTAWPGQLKWSDQIDDGFRSAIATSAGVAIPAATRLTAFDDTSTPRPGTDDLFFDRDPDQRPQVPPPHVFEIREKTHVPADLVAIPIVAGAFLVWRFRRRKRP